MRAVQAAVQRTACEVPQVPRAGIFPSVPALAGVSGPRELDADSPPCPRVQADVLDSRVVRGTADNGWLSAVAARVATRYARLHDRGLCTGAFGGEGTFMDQLGRGWGLGTRNASQTTMCALTGTLGPDGGLGRPGPDRPGAAPQHRLSTTPICDCNMCVRSSKKKSIITLIEKAKGAEARSNLKTYP